MDNASQPQIKGKFTTCKLIKREDLTHDLIKFWLEPEESFNFKPGQYCTIGTGGIERPYSIVSSPDEKTPTFIFLNTFIFFKPREDNCVRSTVLIFLPFLKAT